MENNYINKSDHIVDFAYPFDLTCVCFMISCEFLCIIDPPDYTIGCHIRLSLYLIIMSVSLNY